MRGELPIADCWECVMRDAVAGLLCHQSNSKRDQRKREWKTFRIQHSTLNAQGKRKYAGPGTGFPSSIFHPLFSFWLVRAGQRLRLAQFFVNPAFERAQETQVAVEPRPVNQPDAHDGQKHGQRLAKQR